MQSNLCEDASALVAFAVAVTRVTLSARRQDNSARREAELSCCDAVRSARSLEGMDRVMHFAHITPKGMCTPCYSRCIVRILLASEDHSVCDDCWPKEEDEDEDEE
jgi:hypothetical protein